jgi:hypothetical protein
MAYVPEWEQLAGALKRVMTAGSAEDEARHDICAAMADEKIRVRPALELIKRTILDHQLHHHHAREIMQFTHDLYAGTNRYPHPWELHRPFSVPKDLRPEDLDWERSCFKVPKRIAVRPDMGPMEWNVSLELCSADVTTVLCARPSLEANAERRTAARETAAIKALADHLRSKADVTRQDARSWLTSQGFDVSQRGFQSRIWPEARRRAGLEPLAAPGRKPASSS